MNIAQKVEELFATTSSADLDKLLLKANFDHFNKVGVDVLSLNQAVKEAEKKRNTFYAPLLTTKIDAADRTWRIMINGTPMDLGASLVYAEQDSLFSWAFGKPKQSKPVVPAGNEEEIPFAA